MSCQICLSLPGMRQAAVSLGGMMISKLADLLSRGSGSISVRLARSRLARA